MKRIEPKHDRIENRKRWYRVENCPEGDCYSVDFKGVHGNGCPYYCYQPDAEYCNRCDD